MPFPNEHAARIVDPNKFERFRRSNDELGSGVDVIFGIPESGGSEIQAIRFDRKKFTPAEARAWLKEHDFKAILFEEAETKRETEARHPDGMSGHKDDEEKKKGQSGHDDEEEKPSGEEGVHRHPHANGAGKHDHEGLPNNTGGHAHSEDLSTTDGLHRHRPGDPLEGGHAHKDGDTGKHLHPKALARTMESVQWMPQFQSGDMSQPNYVISGDGARGLFSKLFRLSESASETDGIPYFIDSYAVRWIPENQPDPVTGEINVGMSCWRGGL